ncbi:MAG: circadian clock KaiB family protein [Deltaproteobacteria bacterium]
MYEFKLYIAGQTPQSNSTIEGVTWFLRNSCGDKHVLNIVDILQNPSQAIDDGVFVTPTLVKIEPKPERRIVGSLEATGRLSNLLFD